MANNRINTEKQIEKSAVNYSILLSNTSNNYIHKAPSIDKVLGANSLGVVDYYNMFTLVGTETGSVNQTPKLADNITYSIDSTQVFTDVKTTNTNNVIVPKRIGKHAYLFTNNNGATLVAGVLFNVDTIGSAGSVWQYDNQFSINFPRATTVKYSVSSNVQVRIGDYTSGATPGVTWNLRPILDGVSQSAPARIHNQILTNSNSGVSAEIELTFDVAFNVTAGTHTFGYEYFIQAPAVIAGTVGNPYRHNLNQIYQHIIELPND